MPVVYSLVLIFYEILFSVSAVRRGGWGESAEETAEVIMLPLFPSHRDRRLVFLTEEERAGLAQVKPCSSEAGDSSLLERLFSTDISSVYRLGKGATGVKGGVVPLVLHLYLMLFNVLSTFT